MDRAEVAEEMRVLRETLREEIETVAAELDALKIRLAIANVLPGDPGTWGTPPTQETWKELATQRVALQREIAVLKEEIEFRAARKMGLS